MKIPSIKRLIEAGHSLETLKAAEEALMEEQPLPIEVEGEDEGERLTHLFAAIYILDKMQTEDLDFKQALRAYTQMVRESIN